MPWSTTTGAEAITGGTFIDIGSDGFAVPISLNPGETANIQIEADFPVTPTDDLDWQILSSPDGGTTWDVQPIAAGRLLNGDDPNRVSLSVAGYRTVKVQAARTGSTDLIDVTVRVAKDGVSL